MKTPLLIFYALFFTVQIFFNYDTPSINRHGNIIDISSLSNYPHNSNATYNQDANFGKTVYKSNVRLNKRYEPSGLFLNIKSYSISTPLVYINLHESFIPFKDVLEGITSTFNSRGPPTKLHSQVLI